MITRGARPQDLSEDGPKFLSLPIEEWPIKSAKNLTVRAQETINKLQKKVFSAALTRSKVEQQESTETLSKKDLVKFHVNSRRPPAGSVV